MPPQLRHSRCGNVVFLTDATAAAYREPNQSGFTHQRCTCGGGSLWPLWEFVWPGGERVQPVAATERSAAR